MPRKSKKKKIAYIIMLHDLEAKISWRIDFNSEKKPETLIKSLELKSYRHAQFIQNDFLIEISEIELKEKKISFDTLPRTKRTWFGQ